MNDSCQIDVLQQQNAAFNTSSNQGECSSYLTSSLTSSFISSSPLPSPGPSNQVSQQPQACHYTTAQPSNQQSTAQKSTSANPMISAAYENFDEFLFSNNILNLNNSQKGTFFYNHSDEVSTGSYVSSLTAEQALEACESTASSLVEQAMEDEEDCAKKCAVVGGEELEVDEDEGLKSSDTEQSSDDEEEDEELESSDTEQSEDDESDNEMDEDEDNRPEINKDSISFNTDNHNIGKDCSTDNKSHYSNSTSFSSSSERGSSNINTSLESTMITSTPVIKNDDNVRNEQSK